ncbi:MAG TPA: FHA domain-containing protein [Polyangiaceae bacterium]|nr:FHA domain-containing protein [Polyangiaceae bacterium]
MALLKDLSAESRQCLAVEHLIGRSSSCMTRLDARCVSSTHACIRWNGARWLLQDLGSRNGTYLNDVRIVATEWQVLSVGDRLAFGDRNRPFVLLDASAPQAMVLALESGHVLPVRDGMIAIPGEDEPLATIYWSSNAEWVLDRAGELIPLKDSQYFDVGDCGYRFSCPQSIHETSVITDGPAVVDLFSAQLSFCTTKDEESVEVAVRHARGVLNLGSRAAFYLLLVLARQREQDRARGVAVHEAGWTSLEHLKQMLKYDEAQLNMDVFRIRQRFQQAGIIHGAQIIERESRNKCLRIGAARSEFVTLS